MPCNGDICGNLASPGPDNPTQTPPSKTSIRIEEPGRDTCLPEKNAYVFMMRFTEGLKRKWIQADLVDRAGKVVPLHSSYRYNISKNEYLNVWVADDGRTMIDEDANYHLRIRLSERNLEVARVHLGKLRKWKL